MMDRRLYPLRFEPIFQYRLWGGRRLVEWLNAALPGDEPIGEAWILSDRDDHPSVVADGPLKGWTIARLLEQAPEQLLGELAGRFNHFPLLLKFLDVRGTLSVQVHPSDHQTKYLPAGEPGKTEAWVVLETGRDSRIYAGLRPGTTAENLREALAKGAVADHLASFLPQPGDGVFIPAGTVHALRDVVVFEVQENSDATYRLYNWDHIDAKTGQCRALQVGSAMDCIDFAQGAVGPVVPMVEETKPVRRERLFNGAHFGLWRVGGDVPFAIGATRTPRVVVCVAGEGAIQGSGEELYTITKGDVFLLPAVVGPCVCRPRGSISLLEMSLPEEKCR